MPTCYVLYIQRYHPFCNLTSNMPQSPEHNCLISMLLLLKLSSIFRLPNFVCCVGDSTAVSHLANSNGMKFVIHPQRIKLQGILLNQNAAECMLRTTVISLSSIDLRSRKGYKECNEMHQYMHANRFILCVCSTTNLWMKQKVQIRNNETFSMSRNDFQVENIC